MYLEKIVFGVDASNSNPRTIIDSISLDIEPSSLVGLEVSDSWVYIYRHIAKHANTSSDFSDNFGHAIFKRYNFDPKKDSRDVIEQTFDHHYFYFCALLAFEDLGASVIGLGSDRRIGIMRHYSNDRSGFGRMASHIIEYPHFQKYLVERIQETGCDRIVVGTAHALKIQRPLGCKLRIINEISGQVLQDFQELPELQTVYEFAKNKLPDLRD